MTAASRVPVAALVLLGAVLWSVGASPCTAQEVRVRVTVGVDEVAFGAAFPVIVERVYSKGLVPDTWDAEAFAPLVARTVGSTRVADGDHVRERVSLEAFAFAREVLTIPAIAFRATSADGSEELAAASEPVTVPVVSILAADDDGAAELPGDLKQGPFRWTTWLLPSTLLATAFLALAYFVSRRRRDDGMVTDSSDVRAAARTRLLEIASLEAGASIEETQGWYLLLTDIVRDYIEAAFHVHVPGMTTEQFFISEGVRRALGADDHGRLSTFLRHCDRVKFGRFPTTMEERGDAYSAALRFVEGEAI